MQSWIEFWNAEHSIYVNARHKALHAAGVAKDIARWIDASMIALDYGCGEALYAEEVAQRCKRLDLFDGAPAIQDGLIRRFQRNARISVLTENDIAVTPDGTYDMILANSLIQYLSRNDLETLLRRWRRLLKPEGTLLVADVLPNGQSPIADATALLAFAARGGFLFAALSGLVRTALSDYRKVRTQLGLTTYAERDMLAMLDAAGFDASRVHPNFGHNQSRMTFMARPRPAALTGQS